MKKNAFFFVAGALMVALVYMLIIKPKDRELPTIFDTQLQVEIEKKADAKIADSKDRIERTKKRNQDEQAKIEAVFGDGLSDVEYDSIVRAIERESRQADSIRNAAGL